MEGILKINFNLQNNALVGDNIYVARPEIYSTIGLEEIVAYASKAASIPQSDMYVTVEALCDAFVYFLCNGHSFKLDGVGTFSLSVKTKAGDATSEDVKIGADAIESVGVNFLPDTDLKAMLSMVSINTNPVNDNHLVEFTEPKCSSMYAGAKSLNLLTFASSVALFANAGNKIGFKGYNFEADMVVDIEGTKGEEQMAESITLALLSKKTQTEVQGVITKSYDVIRKATLKKANGTVVAEYDWTDAPIPSNVTLYVGGVEISEGGSYQVSRSQVTASGNLAGVVYYIDGVQVEPIAASATSATLVMSLAAGAHTIVAGDKTYHINVADVATANIISLSANGVTVQSGGSSPVIANMAYNFIATGNNTQLVKESDIVVPAGCTISGFQATSAQVKFTLTTGNVGGTIKVANYTCNLVMEAPTESSPVISSCAQVSRNGIYSMGTNADATLQFSGSNLGSMTASNIKVTANGVMVTGCNVVDGVMTVTLKSSSTASNGTLAVQNADGATIWSCSLQVTQGDGDLEGPVV